MQLELNKSEIELIDKALETWEKDAHSGAMMGAMLGAMLCPKDQREGESAKVKQELRAAEQEGQVRRVKSVLLRAKLYQALSRESEHTVETPTV